MRTINMKYKLPTGTIYDTHFITIVPYIRAEETVNVFFLMLVSHFSQFFIDLETT